MKKIMAIVAFFFLCMAHKPQAATAAQSARNQPKASPIVMYAVANARDEGNKAEWKGTDNYLAATKYIQVTLGPKDYIYTRDGKYVKVRPARYPSAGIMDHYAEVGWDYLDKNMKTFSDTYGHFLLHYTGGKWHKVARNAGDGYDRDNDLYKAGVPGKIVKRLKFE